jgi:antitoxin FitA
MSAIQIKNVPPELHGRLRERARGEGRTLGEYVLTVLERDLALPSTREWLERVRGDEPVEGITSQEIVEAIQEGRAERDEQILSALATGN